MALGSKRLKTTGLNNVQFLRDLMVSSMRLCEISSSHSGEYEAQSVLGFTAMFLIRCQPTFKEVRAASLP
jgi:hypothetical protein